MTTKNLIEGMQILTKYYTNVEGYNSGADHDIFYMYATDVPLSFKDVERMVELGWHQSEVVVGDDEEYEAKHYEPGEGWAAYV